jgi:hypothetical protein
MSDNSKYDKNTLMELLKMMLTVRDDITSEEKQNIIEAMQILLNKSDKDYEDKQRFSITDYKRRN